MAREVELNRFEALYEAYEPAALELNKDAAQVCLAISDRKVKLMGLEPPKAATTNLGPTVHLNFNFNGAAGDLPPSAAPGRVIDAEVLHD